jgi:diketogulonate reductase-like aldo/keto reductase
MDRRQFLARSAALAAAASVPATSFANETMRTRPIPGTNEELPVIGLGAPRVFIELPPEGKDVPKALIHELMSHGGTVIDTPAFNRGKDPILGPLLTEMGIQDDLFLIGKITTSGKQEVADHLEWTQRLLNKRPIDAMLIHNMRDLENNWAILKDWKDAGRVRHIGVSRTRTTDFASLEKFMKAEKPDFLMIGYSITQQGPAERILPLAADIGTAVIGAEPFKAREDGAFFDIVSDKTLPKWAAEFDCESWAHFSLKYILSNPAMTCIVTETTKAHHAEDNMRAGLGRLPDEETRKRMSEYFLNL